jgi:hypothetical protein
VTVVRRSSESECHVYTDCTAGVTPSSARDTENVEVVAQNSDALYGYRWSRGRYTTRSSLAQCSVGHTQVFMKKKRAIFSLSQSHVNIPHILRHNNF